MGDGDRAYEPIVALTGRLLPRVLMPMPGLLEPLGGMPAPMLLVVWPVRPAGVAADVGRTAREALMGRPDAGAAL